MKFFQSILYLFLFFSISFSLWVLLAQEKRNSSPRSPIGFWKTIDDEKNIPSAIVQISRSGKSLQGKIVKVLDLERGSNPRCEKCTGENKNKRLIGMRILKELRRKGNEWGGARILDPKNGKWYRCRMEMQDEGKKLKVRGYIGITLLGRSQYWYRVNSP